MLRSYWSKYRSIVGWAAASTGVLLAVILLYGVGVLVGKNLGYYDAQADGYSSQSEAETNQRINECIKQVPIIRAQECSKKAIESGREYQRDEQNLDAQRQMAKWAFWLLFFTLGQSVLGVFGFIVLIVTIKQGREANEIAREANRRELRAYLSVKSITIDQSDWDVDCLNIEIEMQNAGQTPAVLTKVKVWAVWAFDGGDKSFVDVDSRNETRCHRDTAILIPISFDATDSVFEKSGHLTVIGRLEYTDIFGDSQKEPFSFRTPEGHFMPLNDHVLPIRLAGFSPLSMLETIDEKKVM